MKVLKFGGASLRDGSSLRQVCEIIANTKGDKAVVLSAFNDVTDELDAINPTRTGKILPNVASHSGITSGSRSSPPWATSFGTNPKVVSRFITNLKEEHLEYLKEALNVQPAANYYRTVERQILRLERLLLGLRYRGKITERSRDMVLSFGERLAVVLAVSVLQSMNIPAIALEGDRIGLITDGLFGRASALLPLSRKNIRKHLLTSIKRNIIPVITGYFGVDKQGRTTTFGRGGSDYSAGVVAYALDAEVLEVWKDVDGFMSANPEIVPDARLIEHLSYKEAVELSYFGSTILHPRTVEPVLIKNIPIVIRNTFAPSKKGTVIHKQSFTSRERPIKGLTYESNIGLIKVHGYGAGFGYKSEVICEITRRLLEENINIKTILSAPTGIALVLSKDDFQNAFSVLNQTPIKLVSGFEKVQEQALIGLVGEGITKIKGLAARVFRATAAIGVNVEMITAGASSAAGYFLISNKDIKKTITALYQEFF
ncbi:MAG: aspartate kinase, partial [Planctomycetota bacterium]|nr:aspartate kinase [Planctomycetota bacterium]